VANSWLGAGEHWGCDGQPVGDDNGPGCDSAVQVTSDLRAHATGSAAPVEPDSVAQWLQQHPTRWPGSIRHKGPHGTSGPGCDLVGRVASGLSARAVAAVLAEAVSVVAGAPRHRGGEARRG
jgi:hypothetical protein